MSALELEPLSIDSVVSEKHSKLYALWRELKSDRELPERCDFLPEQARFLLGQISVIEVLRAPMNFHVRLVGTRLEDCGRRGDQGKTLDQMEANAYGDLVRPIYSATVETRRPTVHRITYPIRDGRTCFELLILPFAQGGDAVDTLIEGVDWPTGAAQNFRSIARAVPELQTA